MTNKIVLRQAEEVMSDYVPTYTPIWSLFTKNSQAYPEVVGVVNFRRTETKGDIRMKRLTPKDSNIHQITVGDGTKPFNKYFHGAQFLQSILQDREGNEAVIAEVLDENHKLADEMLFTGDGTSNSDKLNNGLFFSTDANYVKKNSIEVSKASTGYHLPDMHTEMMATISEADRIAGEKVMLIWGDAAMGKFDSLYANTDQPFKSVLKEVADGWNFVKVPKEISDVLTGNGWMAVNLDQIKLNYTTPPKLLSQGVNEEAMHTWHNFIMGSMMVEVKAKGGIIQQPVTFEA